MSGGSNDWGKCVFSSTGSLANVSRELIADPPVCATELGSHIESAKSTLRPKFKKRDSPLFHASISRATYNSERTPLSISPHSSNVNGKRIGQIQNYWTSNYEGKRTDKKKYTRNLPESSKVRVGWWLIYGSSDEVENGEEGDYRCVQSSPHEEFFFVSPGQD